METLTPTTRSEAGKETPASESMSQETCDYSGFRLKDHPIFPYLEAVAIVSGLPKAKPPRMVS